jgi:hypothetical protein
MAIIKITEPEKGLTSKKPTYENLPEGGYEVYVDRASDVTEFEGIEKTSLMFRVRDDVDTEHPRRTVFTNISTAANMGWKLSNIALAAGVPAGTDFKNMKEFLDAVVGKSMKIIVAHREYNGKTYVDAKAFYPTRLKDYTVETPELDLI